MKNFKYLLRKFWYFNSVILLTIIYAGFPFAFGFTNVYAPEKHVGQNNDKILSCNDNSNNGEKSTVDLGNSIKNETSMGSNNANSGKVKNSEQGKENRTNKETSIVSRNDSERSSKVQKLKWFGTVDKLFAIGKTATVTDIDTGLKLQVMRTYGYNHADVETLTAEDTKTLLEIAGGSWNWKRRAVIVEFDGLKIAASMAPRPHAGLDEEPANTMVSGRSAGYGYGCNLDKIKDNNMSGHFDIHFYMSRTHTTNRVDSQHQKMIEKAFKYRN